MKGREAKLQVAFHMPKAMETFIKGLFQNGHIDIPDKRLKARFAIKSIESLPNPLQTYAENEIIQVGLRPLSPVVAGIPDEKGIYDFLGPGDRGFADSLIYNWRNKIITCYDTQSAHSAVFMVELNNMIKPPKSRLLTIKGDTKAATKIRGWMNFGIMVMGEKLFVELLMNGGAGVYNSQGMGYVGQIT